MGFNNTRMTTDNPFSFFSPTLTPPSPPPLTQHLLQGFGWGINGRFIVQAKNDRRIADSAFRPSSSTPSIRSRTFTGAW